MHVCPANSRRLRTRLKVKLLRSVSVPAVTGYQCRPSDSLSTMATVVPHLLTAIFCLRGIGDLADAAEHRIIGGRRGGPEHDRADVSREQTRSKLSKSS